MKKKNIFLIIPVIVILAAAVYFFKFKVPTKNLSNQKNENASITLLQFSKESVREIKINNIRIVKNSFYNKWEIVEPIYSQVDAEKMEELLTLIFSIEYTKKEENADKKLLDYEILIDYELLIITATGSYFIFNPSARAIDGNYYFYTKIDNALYTLNTDISKIFELSLFEIRSKKIFDYSAKDIENLKIIRKNNDVLEFQKVMAFNQSPEWELIVPKKMRVDWLKINNMIDNLLNLKVDIFIDDINNTDSYAITEMQDTLSIILKLNTAELEKNITISKIKVNDTSAILVKSGNNLYAVYDANLESYYDDYLKFRELSLLSANIKLEALQSLIIKKGPKKIELRRQDDRFKSDNIELNNDTDAIDNFISSIMVFQVKDYVSDKASDLFSYNLDKPLFQIFMIFNDNTKYTLNFSKMNEKYYGCLLAANDIIIFKISDNVGDLPEIILPLKKYL
ncbi:MAG TPA: DUF4340 domain-containing protein [bacterium]|nr:DUF4340 domain-containing protein [bacterium]